MEQKASACGGRATSLLERMPRDSTTHAIVEQPERPIAVRALPIAIARVESPNEIEASLQHMTTSDRLDQETRCLAKALMNDLSQRLDLANGLLDAGKTNWAVQQLAGIVRDFPDSAAAFQSLAIAHLQLGQIEDAIEACQRSMQLDPKSAATHNLLGTLFAERGDHEHAIDAFRSAIELRQGNAIAWHNLANSLDRLGRREDALQAYAHAVAADPQLVEAAFELAAAGERPAPSVAPTRFIERLFDGYAGAFDRHLRELAYAVPDAIADLLRAVQPTHHGTLRAIDLGCGTGLAGVAIRPLASSMVGVDLSTGMLDKAREKRIYDTLVAAELVHYLQSTPDRFDLVVAADVFIYLGDLDETFAAVARVLAPDGVFAFSVETASAGNYHLSATRRYQHSPAYVEALAGGHAFRPLARRRLDLRVEGGQPIAGEVYVLQATLSSQAG
jgi:predicted TPR repeat methyltransferase